jgi:hypothetical protein
MPARARAGWPANAGKGERLLDFRTGLRRFLRWSADQAARRA